MRALTSELCWVSNAHVACVKGTGKGLFGELSRGLFRGFCAPEYGQLGDKDFLDSSRCVAITWTESPKVVGGPWDVSDTSTLPRVSF